MICSNCKIEKNIEEFSIRNNGRRKQCKNCVKLRRQLFYQNNKDKLLEYKKDYYSNNKDKVLSHNREYYILNKDKVKKTKSIYNKTYKRKINKEKKNSAIRLKRKMDPSFKIRNYIANAIRDVLKEKKIMMLPGIIYHTLCLN